MDDGRIYYKAYPSRDTYVRSFYMTGTDVGRLDTYANRMVQGIDAAETDAELVAVLEEAGSQAELPIRIEAPAENRRQDGFIVVLGAEPNHDA